MAVLLGSIRVDGVWAQAVVLHTRDAVVWAQDQHIEGRLEGTEASGVLYADEVPVPFEAVGDTFSVAVRLAAGTHAYVACADAGGDAVCSDTLHLTLGYVPRPDVFAWATVAGRGVQLHAAVLEGPEASALAFAWQPDPENPLALTLTGAADTLAALHVPEDAPPGEYYFDLTVTPAEGEAGHARTFVTVDSGGIRPFAIATDHAAWADRAVIYEVTPRFFTNNRHGRLADVTAKLPELVRLGVNTLWLQPIYDTHDGWQAYDVVDYFRVWRALGTEEDLHALIDAAHAAGLRVLFDFVPNHTSIYHPYAQDAITHGAASHYYDFYQRVRDGAPYAQDYHERHEGEMTFIYYFWEDLVNHNFDNPEVERYIVEASKYWVERFGIDGYRLDAVWAPHARDPAFTKAWRLALKRIKPELFLLAEAKAPYPEAYEPGHPSIFESFDAAYDWTAGSAYISRWAFQANNDQRRTIFNAVAEPLRSDRLRAVLTNQGNGFPPGAKILRYLENNDTPRFIESHSVEQTKMAAALMFSLPGIPMLYYGQEVGASIQFPSYPVNRLIASYDDEGLFPFYQHLIRLRETFPALYSDQYEEVAVGPDEAADHVFAFRRWSGGENIVGVINMGGEEAAVALALPVEQLPVDEAATYYLTNLMTGDFTAVSGAGLAQVSVTIPAYTTVPYLLADSVYAVTTPVERPAAELPGRVALGQNYPNPFNPATTIPFVLPRSGAVRLVVYDVLGREAVRLVDGVLPAGPHAVRFDATALPSGAYFYRLEQEGRVVTKSMLLMK